MSAVPAEGDHVSLLSCQVNLGTPSRSAPFRPPARPALSPTRGDLTALAPSYLNQINSTDVPALTGENERSVASGATQPRKLELMAPSLPQPTNSTHPEEMGRALPRCKRFRQVEEPLGMSATRGRTDSDSDSSRVHLYCDRVGASAVGEAIGALRTLCRTGDALRCVEY